MKELFLRYKHLLFIAALVFLFFTGQGAFAQHEGHNMPGVNKPKPKPKAKRKAAPRKRKALARRKQPAKKHNIGSMSGAPVGTHPPTPAPSSSTSPASPQTHEPETHPSSVAPSPAATPIPHERHTPAGMPSPEPQAPASQHDVHVPATSPSPSPQTSPHQMETHMPGMQMPASSSSPNPQASPHKMDQSMPMPSPSEELLPTIKGTGQPSPNFMGSMNMGPLLVMSDNDMSIRVGSSNTNVMPMGQMGSGTSWAPSSTPMYMIHKQSGDWLLMFHYNAVVGVNSQGGPRGVTKFESANWLMPMAFHKLGKGTLQLRAMFSFEPFTFPPGGSPLLFQTGETYKGQPLIDRQHPHDLWMELSAQYTLPLGERGTWFTYFGYPGEPALGPTAFMHRFSASENSSAPLSHHLQDSSHISFGVFTTGFTYRWFKLEGSLFNGREPDENRYNFEGHPWNSRSVRLSFAPNSNWSMQVSHGLLRNPEALEPGDVRRTTASISYNKPLERGNWATSLIWGRNHESHSGETFNLNGYVAESTVNFLDKNYLYTRLELVDKNQLLRAVDRARLGIIDDHPSFRIGAYTFGGARDVWTTDKISMAIGSDLTLYSKTAVLDPIYGANPVSWKLFVRFRPARMVMTRHGDAHGDMKH